MSTRSGRSFKRKRIEESADQEKTTAAEEMADQMAEMMRVLLEDRERRERELQEERERREQELREERRRRDEETAKREEEARIERQRRDEEVAKREEETRQQMELLRGLLEGVQKQSEATMLQVDHKDVKVAKLTSEDDIEAYLTTFERLMKAHNVKKDRWTYKLTPHLTGKAQQAYVAMAQADAEDYEKVKAAILRRYDVTAESYRQRFRAAKLKTGETHRELSVRLDDLLSKWLKTCETVEEIKDQLVKEQLLKTLPADVCIFVREGKPETSDDVCRLADNYVAAHKNEETKPEPREVKKETGGRWKLGGRRDLKDIDCFNCHQKGHYSFNCPSNALFCGVKRVGNGVKRTGKWNPGVKRGGKWSPTQTGMKRAGAVEGNNVQNILLDTGCSRSLVRKELVPPGKLLEGEAIAIQCAHGDTVLYPLAQVEVAVGGRSLEVTAAVSETLPMDVLLGTDVPELGMLLGQDIGKHAEAMAVTTRAQAKQQAEQEADLQERDARSGASVTGIAEPSLVGPEWMDTFDDDLFEGGRVRVRPSRSQKRAARRRHWEQTPEEVEAEHGPLKIMPHAVDITAGQLRVLQEADASLDEARKLARDHPCSTGVGFFLRDGLLHRRWTAGGQNRQEPAIEQLVLPTECRKVMLKLAHDIPLSGHMGKEKTAKRILQQFYWPTLYRDVAAYCRSCMACQKTSQRKPPRAPLHPLPIITEPFSRIAMDIIGPLPRSRSGKRYVLVICDYATRYPEAVPLRSIDAEHVAEELVVLFSRVGIPREILTDQGSNFVSQLLTEMYRLLHVHPIRTTPYHPQTDGLVERFNQTLKSMLRRTATEEGKDWDRLIPYLLFAYREVPQSSTGFSPFELLYGRSVRGPLDVLHESWTAREASEESVVSHILSMREKMEKMAGIVKDNLRTAQARQKHWYDRNARMRELMPGEQVLILLPTTTNKLQAQWQGPYQVVKRVSKVDYLVNLHDRRKKNRVYHVNMLRKFEMPTASAYFAEERAGVDDDPEDIPTWRDSGNGEFHVGEQLTETQQADLHQLLNEFSDVFQCKPGCTSKAEHVIDSGNAAPIRLPPYRIPHAYRAAVKEELEGMLADGIIEPSTSAWSAPIVLVKKSDGSLRLCVDYRRLNQVSQFDAYPMPRVEELIDRIGKSKYISTMDLARGYWQVPMAPKDREKTAFATPYGLFQFNVMPFGLKGAPATFQRLMDLIVQGLDEISGSYIDDLVVFSETWAQHLEHLRAILTRLRAANLTAKAKKCKFGATQCVYLGHIVGSGLVKPLETKIHAVNTFKTPTTKKEVRTFLGMTGYYRKFIPNYSMIATPLTDLTKKSQPTKVIWTSECARAFQELKEILTSPPVLNSPDFNRPFTLQTDASDRGVGAVLSQMSEDGSEHPVAYWSRKLLDREQRYSTVEKECLAIKLAVEAFQVYLLGRPFTIVTDHHALVWMDRLKVSNTRLARWSLALQPFEFTVVHRPGKENANADAMSRAM